MILASADDLLAYLADLVDELERYAITLLPPADADEIALAREPDGSLVVELAGRLPVPPRSAPVELDIFERWRPAAEAGLPTPDAGHPAGARRSANPTRSRVTPGRTLRDAWACVEYGYELRHHELGYRRALHRHDEAWFVRLLGVATHEHCEATIGVATCSHYEGRPVADGFDAFRRLYALWLTDERPACDDLTCLG